jgi:ubiquinone/menaquinone biosynthesis C-methylase UbiE
MENDAEKIVSRFYNEGGWVTVDGLTEDARQFEDLRSVAENYVSKCRLRVLTHIPKSGDKILDMASGPIQFPEYLEYSKNFNKRYCVDLSSAALDQAKKKILDHGVFLHGSFFAMEFQKDYFDCSISLHTIYHIDKDKQEEAVRKLIHVTKAGHPIIIVYSNPNTLLSVLGRPVRKAKKLLQFFKKTSESDNLSLYFYSHPLSWWNKFSDIAIVKIYPFRSFASHHQKRLFPSSSLGSKMLGKLFHFEERFPRFFVKFFQYPMIVLTKR